MPTSSKVKKVLIESLPPLGPGVIYELGAGFGHLAIPVCRKYRERKVVALEISPFPYAVLWLLQKVLQLKNLEVKRQNFFHRPLSDAAAVICYLYPGAMKKLEPKFEAELKEGAFVITHTFALPTWKAESVRRASDLYRSEVIIYCKKQR